MSDECQDGDFAADTEDAVKTHQQVQQHGNYQCELCQSTFSAPINLLEHLETVHSNLQKYKCEKCDFAAACKKSLAMHMNNVHGPRYSCQICELRKA
jgi:hypothetical protein